MVADEARTGVSCLDDIALPSTSGPRRTDGRTTPSCSAAAQPERRVAVHLSGRHVGHWAPRLQLSLAAERSAFALRSDQRHALKTRCSTSRCSWEGGPVSMCSPCMRSRTRQRPSGDSQ